MKPRKGSRPIHLRKKPAVTFDEDSRRAYLTGFQKRKKQRKKKAKLNQLQKLKDARKKARSEKREAIKKKLDAYGLEEAEPSEDQTNTGSLQSQRQNVGTDQSSTDNRTSNSFTYEEHPNHLVIVNTDPDFGNSLSALVNEET